MKVRGCGISLPCLRAAFVAALTLLPGQLLAEHEADHRYVVEGYVLDASEEPRAGVDVSVRGPEGMLGTADTNSQGFYRVRLHLHNEDLGKRLTVRAGESEAGIEVTFDPGDKSTARIHPLSFIGDRVVEGNIGFQGVPLWLYGVAGAVLVFAGAGYAASRLRKRRRRQARALEKEKSGRRGKKRKKGKR